MPSPPKEPKLPPKLKREPIPLKSLDKKLDPPLGVDSGEGRIVELIWLAKSSSELLELEMTGSVCVMVGTTGSADVMVDALLGVEGSVLVSTGPEVPVVV